MSGNSRIGLLSDLIKESKEKRDNFSFNNSEAITEPQKTKKILINSVSKKDEISEDVINAKSGRPLLEDEHKRRKCIVYLTRTEQRQIKILYKDKNFNKLSPSVRKAISDLFKLKERERKQIGIIQKLVNKGREELKIINKKLSENHLPLTDKEKSLLTIDLDKTTNTIQSYLNHFQITDIEEIKEYFKSEEFKDLRFLSSRSV